jgi:hypothetical protein
MVAVLPSIGAGTTMAFSSIAASEYRTANATSLIEPLTDDESSWFGKLPNLQFISFILGPFSNNIVQREVEDIVPRCKRIGIKEFCKERRSKLSKNM